MEIELKFFNEKAIMKIDGIVTSENAYVLQNKFNEVLESQVKRLEIDLSACRNISSTGIGKILLFYKDFINKKGELEVVKSSQSIYELLTTIKLNQLFTINL
ncbi:MAG: STAS domain-containing protein [Candidatus Cloacimonetes bacterium]|nr:STAS domain-containing protein [Candidatus Cloacimonadota bacterium]